MIVDFAVISHEKQRYPTVGDWRWSVARNREDGETLDILTIRVSKMSDPRYELLVFHHELTEALLCREAGVATEMVDEWDKDYEKRRSAYAKAREPREESSGPGLIAVFASCGCIITETSEPGDDPHCPCFKEHQTATTCEKKMAKALGVDWNKYDAEVESL